MAVLNGNIFDYIELLLNIPFSHRYGLESHEHLWTSRAFKKSCRGVSFTPDGSSEFFFLLMNMTCKGIEHVKMYRYLCRFSR
jgi:hypothetical protein